VHLDVDEKVVADRVAARLVLPDTEDSPTDEVVAAGAPDVSRAHEVVRRAMASRTWTADDTRELRAAAEMAGGASEELAAVIRELFAAINRGDVTPAGDFPIL
jgi:hypothetical protein